ncbi:uncharacterized mitochondrial protein AtMg00810-like [Andrographis paniculata]|uniref:uncharacterized mitochondrial protein AtMg00810-like n=1 Tax=Andrographis paniculata TaxID=175694 RepID=UPI0021E7EC3F|nr:uncharacterized mitochondrial protein AtMg00810-like [Andrographis paniculata]
MRSESKPTLYAKRNDKGEFQLVCIYVDDMIYLGSSETLVVDFKMCMMREFEISDLGMLSYFLGLEVKQAEDRIFLSQNKYANDLLLKFGMHNCKAAATPMNTNEKLQLENGTKATDPSYFRRLIGELNYLTHIRPDIMYSLHGFSDRDWAVCIDDRKSVSGQSFNLGSGAISWSSRKRDIVTLSSSEAEYVFVTAAACQVVWLGRY